MEMAQYGLTFMCDNPKDIFFCQSTILWSSRVIVWHDCFCYFLFIPKRPIEHGLSSYDFKMNNNTSRYPDGEN